MPMMEAKGEYVRPSDPGERSIQVAKDHGLESKSASPFERANTVPKSNRGM